MRYLEYIDLTLIRKEFNGWFDHFGFEFPKMLKPYGFVSTKSSGFLIQYALEVDEKGAPCVNFFIDHPHGGTGYSALNERGEAAESVNFDDWFDECSPRLYGVGGLYELRDEDKKRYNRPLLGAKLHLFWDDSPFSQWHKCSFKVYGIEFNSAEQYMMYMKAVIFEDYETADKILEAKEPKEQKQLGRQVKGFDQKRWNEQCRRVVYDASRHKFRQNEELLNALLATDGCYLAEASPYDTIWGIGLSADSPDAKRPEKWRGKNWLGDMLTLLREDIKYNNERYSK